MELILEQMQDRWHLYSNELQWWGSLWQAGIRWLCSFTGSQQTQCCHIGVCQTEVRCCGTGAPGGSGDVAASIDEDNVLCFYFCHEMTMYCGE